jgi:TorA maturation chaperone TorD
MIATTELTGQAAALLSRWWSRPTEENRVEWGELWGLAATVAAGLGQDPNPIEDLGHAARDADVLALLDEYERLFVGPGAAPCLPYESLWGAARPRRDAGSVMGPAAIAVADLYGVIGLSVRPEAHELPDHLMLEWEAVSAAIARGATEAAGELLDTHLARWMPAFCECVAAETTLPFYRALATITRDWTDALSA